MLTALTVANQPFSQDPQSPTIALTGSFKALVAGVYREFVQRVVETGMVLVPLFLSY